MKLTRNQAPVNAPSNAAGDTSRTSPATPLREPARVGLPSGSPGRIAADSADRSARNKAFKAVIFDLDNTLADAKLVGDTAFDAAFQAIRQANHGRLSESQLQDAFAACWHTAFYTVAAEHGFSAEMTEAGAQAFRNLRVPEEASYQGYGDLEMLQQLPMKRHLVTSGFRDFQNSKVERLGIRDDFDSIQIDDPEDHLPDAGPGKTPLFEKICAQQGIRPDEVLVVGDNPASEIAAGNALGMTTIQVLRPGIEASGDAHHQISDLSELLDALGVDSPPHAQA